ncbi:MAG: hypothetical protein HZB59_09730 [Ignavibacteriales bacterium]|nr:hypothetical protein [Ignavibacteriales bacterium]
MEAKTILKAGIVAGLIICLSAATMVPVVGSDMDNALAKFNLPPLSIGDMIFFFFVSLFLGMMLMWLYYLTLPLFKQKMKTIIVAVLIIWVPGNLLANIANVVYGFMPVKLTIIGISWGFLELLLAGVLSSRLCEESEQN